MQSLLVGCHIVKPMPQHGSLAIRHSTIILHVDAFQHPVGGIQVQTQGRPVIEFVQALIKLTKVGNI